MGLIEDLFGAAGIEPTQPENQTNYLGSRLKMKKDDLWKLQQNIHKAFDLGLTEDEVLKQLQTKFKRTDAIMALSVLKRDIADPNMNKLSSNIMKAFEQGATQEDILGQLNTYVPSSLANTYLDNVVKSNVNLKERKVGEKIGTQATVATQPTVLENIGSMFGLTDTSKQKEMTQAATEDLFKKQYGKSFKGLTNVGGNTYAMVADKEGKIGFVKSEHTFAQSLKDYPMEALGTAAGIGAGLVGAATIGTATLPATLAAGAVAIGAPMVTEGLGASLDVGLSQKALSSDIKSKYGKDLAERQIRAGTDTALFVPIASAVGHLIAAPIKWMGKISPDEAKALGIPSIYKHMEFKKLEKEFSSMPSEEQRTITDILDIAAKKDIPLLLSDTGSVSSQQLMQLISRNAEINQKLQTLNTESVTKLTGWLNDYLGQMEKSLNNQDMIDILNSSLASRKVEIDQAYKKAEALGDKINLPQEDVKNIYSKLSNFMNEVKDTWSLGEQELGRLNYVISKFAPTKIKHESKLFDAEGKQLPAVFEEKWPTMTASDVSTLMKELNRNSLKASEFDRPVQAMLSQVHDSLEGILSKSDVPEISAFKQALDEAKAKYIDMANIYQTRKGLTPVGELANTSLLSKEAQKSTDLIANMIIKGEGKKSEVMDNIHSILTEMKRAGIPEAKAKSQLANTYLTSLLQTSGANKISTGNLKDFTQTILGLFKATDEQSGLLLSKEAANSHNSVLKTLMTESQLKELRNLASIAKILDDRIKLVGGPRTPLATPGASGVLRQFIANKVEAIAQIGIDWLPTPANILTNPNYVKDLQKLYKSILNKSVDEVKAVNLAKDIAKKYALGSAAVGGAYGAYVSEGDPMATLLGAGAGYATGRLGSKSFTTLAKAAQPRFKEAETMAPNATKTLQEYFTSQEALKSLSPSTAKRSSIYETQKETLKSATIGGAVLGGLSGYGSTEDIRGALLGAVAGGVLARVGAKKNIEIQLTKGAYGPIIKIGDKQVKITDFNIKDPSTLQLDKEYNFFDVVQSNQLKNAAPMLKDKKIKFVSKGSSKADREKGLIVVSLEDGIPISHTIHETSHLTNTERGNSTESVKAYLGSVWNSKNVEKTWNTEDRTLLIAKIKQDMKNRGIDNRNQGLFDSKVSFDSFVTKLRAFASGESDAIGSELSLLSGTKRDTSKAQKSFGELVKSGDRVKIANAIEKLKDSKIVDDEFTFHKVEGTLKSYKPGNKDLDNPDNWNSSLEDAILKIKYNMHQVRMDPKQHKAVLQELLRYKPNFEGGKLYRGISLNEDKLPMEVKYDETVNKQQASNYAKAQIGRLNEIKPGDVITETQMTSTSYDPDMAKLFAIQYNNPNSFLLEFNVPKGKHYKIPLELSGDFADSSMGRDIEAEVVLMPNSKFKVQGIENIEVQGKSIKKIILNEI